jgi:undecaprenyl-diphosphatase
VFHPIDDGLLHLINAVRLPRSVDLLIAGINANSLLRALILAGPYVYLWHREPKAQTRAQLVMAIFAAGVSVLVARALAHMLPFSVRPLYNLSAGFKPLDIPFHPDMENWSSFPSDTAALCTAITLGFFTIAPRVSTVLTLSAFVLFVLPRVYLGLHYPSDIMMGMLIGAGCAALASLAARSDFVCRMTERAAPAWPEAFYPIALLALATTTEMFDGLRALLWTFRAAL